MNQPAAASTDANSADGINVRNVSKLYPVRSGFFRRETRYVHAVDDVSISIPAGGAFGIVGESGCGKTTLSRLMVKLAEPTSGQITMDLGDGHSFDLSAMNRGDTRRFRRQAQMIYQDPYESLNPRRTVMDTIMEPLGIQKIGNFIERREMVFDMMSKVGLTPVRDFMMRYPHELSGGQRQRVAIARALVLKPSLVVADEPTSMLDVSVRASIMRLMLDLREAMEMTFVYVTHDMAVARYMCDQLAVMYAGKIVETGPTESVLQDPAHPYTKALLSAVPVPDPSYKRSDVVIKGGVTSPTDPPPRCRFYERCVAAGDICHERDHPVGVKWDAGRTVACHVLEAKLAGHGSAQASN